MDENETLNTMSMHTDGDRQLVRLDSREGCRWVERVEDRWSNEPGAKASRERIEDDFY